MSEPYKKTDRPWAPQRYRQEAHSPEAKLPEGDVVFCLLDTMSQLDLSRFCALYAALTYLAPSVCTVAISTRRLVSLTDRTVTFTSRPPGSARRRTTTLDAIACIRFGSPQS